MTVPLPYALPTSTGWQAIDKLDDVVSSAPAGAAGLATITLPALDTATRWVFTHMVASCTSTTATQMRLYFDAAGLANLRDGTDAGNFGVADWAPGLFVPEGTSVVAQWTGATPGAVATLAYQADVYRRLG